MRRVAALAALVATLAVPTSAGAATLTDPEGDVGAWPEAGASDDVVRGTAGHKSKGRLYHTVSLAGPARDPAEHTPLILIETGDRMSRWCDYVIGRTDFGLGVYDCDYMDRVGSVKVSRSGNKVRFTFKRSAIGSPSEYGWAVVVRRQTQGTMAEYDRAPTEEDTFVSYR